MKFQFTTSDTQITTSHQPLHLKHVLHAPKSIKNLIYVRWLTTYNNVSVSFDPFGFIVSDFQMGITLLKCDSCGDLYPVTTPTSFAGLMSSLWHGRLGHCSMSVLNYLHKNKFICCDSIVLEKHVKLPFFLFSNYDFDAYWYFPYWFTDISNFMFCWS